jgi:type I restriction enzyme S subunit
MTEIVRLGDLCHTTSGGTPSRSRPEFFGGEIPWVKSGNLNDGLVYEIDESISAEGLASSSAKIFPAGTLLIAMYGATVGRLGILGREAATNQAVCGIQPNNEIDRDFLFHCLLHKRKELVGKSVGGAQPNISQAIIRDTLVPLPPLDEQRRIVGLLDRAAEIRRRADAARVKARAIIPALFLDTFGDPATNPKGWPVVELGDVITRITGGKNIEAGNGTSQYRIMKVSAVTSGIFKAHESKPAPDDHIPAEDHHVRPGDFLFSRANTSELVGAVAIADDVPAGLLLPDKIWRIEWTPARMEPRFAYSLLRSSEIRRIFAVIGSGTSGSMKNISQTKLVRVPIPLPPRPIQTAFAEQTHRLDSLARHLDAAAAKAEAMAAGLSAEVFG